MNETEFRELSAGHALGTLPPDDERTYELALAEHPEWAAIASEDLETAAALGNRLPAVAAPAALRAQLLSAITNTPQTKPAASGPALRRLPPELEPDDGFAEATPSRWNLKRTMVALVASVAVLSMIAIGTSSLFQARSTPDEVIALQQVEAAPDASAASAAFTGGSATLHWSESLGQTVLVADGLPQLDEGRAFELWFVRDETPVSAGTFTSSNGTGVAVLSGDMQPGDVVAVTVENQGGSPTGLPTTQPFLAINTA